MLTEKLQRDEEGLANSNSDASAEVSVPAGHKLISRRHLAMGAAAILGLVILAWFGIPWIELLLTVICHVH